MTWKKKKKDIDDLNNAINQVVLIHIYQTPSNSKLGSFSSTHGTLTSIEQMLGQRRCPNKLKGIKYIWNMFWKLTESKWKSITKETWKTNKYVESFWQQAHFLNRPEVKEEFTREIMEMKTQHIKLVKFS